MFNNHAHFNFSSKNQQQFINNKLSMEIQGEEGEHPTSQGIEKKMKKSREDPMLQQEICKTKTPLQ